MRAAEALIGEAGPRAFTLREVARRAGVSHNAPYRHFASCDELLLAVAAEGFERLRATMVNRMERGHSARERLVHWLRLRGVCSAMAQPLPGNVRPGGACTVTAHGRRRSQRLPRAARRNCGNAAGGRSAGGTTPSPRHGPHGALVHGIGRSWPIGGNLPLSKPQDTRLHAAGGGVHPWRASTTPAANWSSADAKHQTGAPWNIDRGSLREILCGFARGSGHSHRVRHR